MLVLDTEIYRDYLLISFKDPSTQKVRHFEAYEGKELDRRTVSGLMRSYLTVSFNGNGFDLPLIAFALTGASVSSLKAMADRIIMSKTPAWRILRDAELSIPRAWDHIDLMEVAPGQASLKIYGGRLGAARMQDLPIEPDASISPEQRDLMRRYCENDLDTTALLYEALAKPLKLRGEMSQEYGLDLRSKSDAQIAETVIKSELSNLSGKTYRAPKLPSDYGFRYRDPGVIAFESEQLQKVYADIRRHRFTLSDNGSVQMPDWLKATKLKIGDAEYQMGIGGLHSCEKRQYVKRDDGMVLSDWDVASYYPNIILQQQLAPETLGRDFLRVYGSIVKRRLAAKAAGDKSTADTLKICVNGSFGKLGSKYSALYSPDLLIQTTITGQLALLMLIERMEKAGVRVISANTDGIVVYHPQCLMPDVERITWDWMLDTSYTLERTDYDAIASRDVNNYLAVKPDGSTKGKGCFADGGLMKNPDQRIVYKAVAEKIASGTPIAQTVTESNNVLDFVTVRQVKGGAVWRGEKLGKAVRFYLSRSVPEDECIKYAKNGNRVPKSAGAMPLMDLPYSFPDDIDYSAYIVAAEKLLCEVGYKEKG
ncbi:MAG: hypothetical protein R3268_00240 [Acidiferrobacterales bacterium]|nr:hypothetical protein [Acidiferrobacterales bacterium]